MVSQRERVWAVLRDGKPHTIQEIHFRAGTMRLNSRVAEIRAQLRADGKGDIACWRHDGTYCYQLVGSLDEGESAMPNAGPISPSSSVTEGAPTLAVYGQGGRRAGLGSRVGHATLSEGDASVGARGKPGRSSVAHTERPETSGDTSGAGMAASSGPPQPVSAPASPSESVEGDTAGGLRPSEYREVAGMPDGASLTGSGQGMQPQSASRPSPASGSTPCPEQLSLDVVRAEEELAAAGQSAWGPWERGENW